jgi:uncharacterized phiE125 gp8 family phage protein
MSMIPILIDGPAVEPVGLAEMRAYLRLDDTAEDDLTSGLIKAARLMVEAFSRRILVEQRWRIVLDRWPSGRVITLPLSPLLAVDRIQVTDASGETVDLPAASYRADALADPPRIPVGDAAPEPGPATGGIVIELRAGFGPTADHVPASLRLAMKILVARWFENRGDAEGTQSLPAEALALVAPFRRARL